MKKEEFEQQIQTMIPQPSPETTAALYALRPDTMDEDGPQSIFTAFDFIARNFDRSVLQSTYEIIRHGSAALPGGTGSCRRLSAKRRYPCPYVSDSGAGLSDALPYAQENGRGRSSGSLRCSRERETEDFYSMPKTSPPPESLNLSAEFVKYKNSADPMYGIM